MATQTQIHHRHHHPATVGRSNTPLFALQIFSGALIFTVAILTILMFLLRTVYDWEPTTVSHIAYSPIYAVAMAGACLVLSFLIPEYLLDSVRREMKTYSKNRQTEDIPFILVPCIFVRYALLACVSMIGFFMAISGSTSSAFLPFAIVALALMGIYFPTDARMKAWLKAE